MCDENNRASVAIAMKRKHSATYRFFDNAKVLELFS